MPRLPSWRQLIPGITAIVVALAGAVVVARYARVGAIHGETFPLVVLAGDIGDLANGSEVWLGGQKVGLVDAVTYRPPDTDTAYRLRMDLTILERARPLLRADSRARVAIGGTLLGASVLSLSVGTPEARPLQRGDTILAERRIPPASLAERVGGLAEPAAELRENLTEIVRQGGSTGGSLGRIATGEVGTELARLATAIQELPGASRPAAESGAPGSALLAAGDGRLRDRATRLRASVDSVRQLLSGSSGSLGRFRRDSTLLSRVTGLRDEAAILHSLTGEAFGEGESDSGLTSGLAGVEAELSALISDMKRRPLRYLMF